ncbi:MAG: hypothetical protein WA773_16685 [Bradyrhizobium sp.]
MTGRAYGAAGDVKFCDEKRLLPRAADKAFHYRLIVKLKQLHPRFDNISFADLDAPNPNLVLGVPCVRKLAVTPYQEACAHRHVSLSPFF